MIRTVLKDIDKNDLGWCQCHEHLFIKDGPSKALNPALFMEDFDKSVRELGRYKAAGGKSVVDAQPFKCGRMSENLVRAGSEAGINIIACTGFHKLEFFEDARWLKKQTEESVTDIFIEEIKQGMYDSGGNKTMHKAGVIKCAAAVSFGSRKKEYDKLLSSVRNAARETNAPVMVHMDKGTDALGIIDFFEKGGVRADKLMFCHLDRANYDFKYHEDVAGTGAYLEYDTIHRYKYHDNAKEIELIKHMVLGVFSEKLMLSLDTTSKRLKSYGGAPGLDYILTEFKFELEKEIGSQAIYKFMNENPANYLDF